MKTYSILFVDDMTFYRSLLQDHLKLWSNPVNLTYCTNAMDAIEKLKEGNFDLIISDLMMPKHTGYDLLKSVRKSAKYKNVPFIMLSSQENQKVILKIIETGADEYLNKPWDVPDLHRILNKFLLKES